jgi:hypothetical protein
MSTIPDDDAPWAKGKGPPFFHQPLVNPTEMIQFHGQFDLLQLHDYSHDDVATTFLST